MSKTKLLLSEKIDRARNGKSQSSIVEQMQGKGIKINDVQFSRKKKGKFQFTEQELEILSEILSTDLTQ